MYNPLQTLLHYATAHLNYWVRAVVIDVPKSSTGTTPNNKDLAGAQAAAASFMNLPASASPNSSLGGNAVQTMLIYLEQASIDEKWKLNMLALQTQIQMAYTQIRKVTNNS